MRKPNNYNKIIHVLQELHSSYPSFNIGRHISTALSEYGDVWGLSDKEFLFALQQYKEQLDMDVPREAEEDIEKLTKDALSLTFNEEEEEDI